MTAVKPFYRARVEVLQGNRFVSEMMKSAGLGIEGVGEPTILVLDYKVGEVVDEVRVRKAIEDMIAASEKQKTSFKIVSYKVLDIVRVENE